MVVNSIGNLKAKFPYFQSTFSKFFTNMLTLPVPIAMGVTRFSYTKFVVTLLVISANFSSHSSNAFFAKGRDDE